MARFVLANQTDLHSGDLKRFVTRCLNNELEDETIIIGFDYNKDAAVEDMRWCEGLQLRRRKRG